MGKKTAEELIRAKKQKTKHKQMFIELATHQQEVVQRKQVTNSSHPKRVMQIDSQEDVELEVLEHENNDLDAIIETVHKLLSKNKVSAKNAFDIPLIDLQRLPDFTNSLDNDYAWKKLSSTLQNDYKIYAYRVDAIHSITFNILHSMNRRQEDVENLQNAAKESVLELAPIQSIKISKGGAEGEHLEGKIENINLTEIQLALGFDPILERNKRKFDQLGNQNMLLDQLQIDEHLSLQLVNNIIEKRKYPSWGQYTDIWKTDEPLMALVEISQFRAKREELEGKMRDQTSYQYLLQEKENISLQNLSDHRSEHLSMPKRKQIWQQLKLKPSKLANPNELLEQANLWLEERGYFNKKSTKIQLQRPQIKLQNPQDLVNFDLITNGQQDTRKNIFRKQNDKGEFHDQIQDRFLLANRLVYNFQISKYPLTLKQNPSIQIKKDSTGTQIDIRRQNISILDAKQKMRKFLHPRSTFKSLYQQYKKTDEIQPALCFLTLLHLCNEDNLRLDQIDEANFYIKG